MRSIHVLKVLPNGWQVSYPEEAFYGDSLLLLKDNRLNGCPGEARDLALPYEDYLEWLQDYLFRCEIILSAGQSRVPESIDGNPQFECASLGWHAGFYESMISRYPEYDFPDNFENEPDIDHLQGIVYKDPYAEFPACRHSKDGPPPGRLEYIFRDYGDLFLKKKDDEQFRRYWPGFVKLEPLHWMFGRAEDHLESADTGWRVYLSLILKKKENRTDRIAAQDRFFVEYADIIHK